MSYSIKNLALLLSVPLLVNCTVQTKFAANFVAIEPPTLETAKSLTPRDEKAITAKSCFTKAGFPHQWELKTDTVLKKALSSRPQSLGLIDAEFTSEVFVIGIFNRVCLIVKGQPVYAEAS